MVKHFHDAEDQRKVKFDLFQILDEWWPEKCKKTLVELHANVTSDLEIEIDMEGFNQVIKSVKISGQKLTDFVVTHYKGGSPFYCRIEDKQTTHELIIKSIANMADYLA